MDAAVGNAEQLVDAEGPNSPEPDEKERIRNIGYGDGR